MAKAALFTAVWSRCPKHISIPLKDDEAMCNLCKIIERNLSLIPPFDVYSTKEEFQLKKDEVYTVRWTILEGRAGYDVNRGYVLKGTDNTLYPFIIPAENFIPIEYLTEDKQDSWLVGS